jgi:hypothetical protein
MASDGNSGQIPITSPVHGSQATVSVNPQLQSGKSLPPNGKDQAAAAAGAAAAKSTTGVSAAASKAPVPRAAPTPPPVSAPPAPAPRASDAQSLVAALNKNLNDSGRPDQYRVAPQSDDKVIQQVNPATGEVVGQFSVSEFPALARSVGVAGVLIDSHV